MPRKTIAGLTAEIERLTVLLEEAEEQRQFMADKIEALEDRPVHVYMEYQPTGDPELDTLQVTCRAIESLRDGAARHRVATWLGARFPWVEEE